MNVMCGCQLRYQVDGVGITRSSDVVKLIYNEIEKGEGKLEEES